MAWIKVVSVATNEHYRAGLQVQVLAVADHWPGVFHAAYRGYPKGCPTHEERMYAFKPYALNAEKGCEQGIIIWMDAWFAPLAGPSKIVEATLRDGWYVAPQYDCRVGEYSTDATLEYYGITREDAWKIPLVFSGLVALDLRTEIGREILKQWTQAEADGIFIGPHRNVPGAAMRPWGQKWEGHCSHDPGVSGHRHDETALSIILWQLGLELKKEGILTLENPESGVIGHHLDRGRGYALVGN